MYIYFTVLSIPSLEVHPISVIVFHSEQITLGSLVEHSTDRHIVILGKVEVIPSETAETLVFLLWFEIKGEQT